MTQKLYVISVVFQFCPIQLLTKIGHQLRLLAQNNTDSNLGSITMQLERLRKTGRINTGADVSFSLITLNVSDAAFVQVNFPVFIQFVIGTMRVLKCRMKHLQKTTSPWKLLTSNKFFGIDHYLIASTFESSTEILFFNTVYSKNSTLLDKNSHFFRVPNNADLRKTVRTSRRC